MHKWFRASDADSRLANPAGQGYLQDEGEVHGTKARKHLLQILLVEEVYLFREIRPVETPRKLDAELVVIVACTLTRQLDFPTEEVVQQSHVRLDKHG